MANDGFTRQLTTPVDIPEIQPIQPSRDEVGDILQLASFGLGLYNREQAKKKEANRQLRLEELTGKSQEIATDLLSALEQNDLSSVQQAVRVNRAINSITASPTEREFVRGQVGSILKSDLVAAAIEEEKSYSDLMTREILKYPPAIQGVILGGKNLDQMTEEQKRDALDAGRAIAMKAEQQQMANEKFSASPTVSAFGEALEASFSLEYSVNEQLLGSLMGQVAEAGGDPQSIELLSQAKDGLVRQLRAQETLVNSMYNQVLKDPSVIKEQRSKATAFRDNALNNIERMKTSLETMDEQQFKNAANMANLLRTQMEVSLRESAPEVFKLKEFSGQGYNALMSVLLNRLPKFKEAGINILEKAAMTGFLASPEGQATLAQSFDMRELNHMLEGKGLGEYDQEKADALAGMRWNMVAPLVENPEMLDQQPQKLIDNMLVAMVQVLDRADEVGDKDSLVNANKLLSSPAVESLISRASSEESQKVLANYVASSTAALIENKLKDTKVGKGLVYDTEQSKFVEDIGVEKPLELSFLGVGKPISEVRMSRTVQDMNRKLDHAANILVNYNPAVDNVKQAKDYLLIGVSPNNIRGELSPIKDTQIEAIKRAVELKEIEEELELKQRVKDLSERIKSGGRTTLEALEKELLEEDPKEVKALRLQALRKKHPELSELSDEEIMAGL